MVEAGVRLHLPHPAAERLHLPYLVAVVACQAGADRACRAAVECPWAAFRAVAGVRNHAAAVAAYPWAAWAVAARVGLHRRGAADAVPAAAVQWCQVALRPAVAAPDVTSAAARWSAHPAASAVSQSASSSLHPALCAGLQRRDLPCGTRTAGRTASRAHGVSIANCMKNCKQSA